ncbi:hypothetical protein [Streptomyces hyaluromycini]|uniref:hypothetical protein n=1 Tax=Streptomyces hyaluromycini TaxID=1377993 RepID=UPI000B5C23DB|nr:hypothetical protein [Streptomyces hyaluromycini]
MAEEAREQQNGSQRGVESFDEIVKGVESPPLLDFPWVADDHPWTPEKNEALFGIVMALLRGDSYGSKYLMSQACKTWEDVIHLSACVIDCLIEFGVKDKEAFLELLRDAVIERAGKV